MSAELMRLNSSKFISNTAIVYVTDCKGRVDTSARYFTSGPLRPTTNTMNSRKTDGCYALD